MTRRASKGAQRASKGGQRTDERGKGRSQRHAGGRAASRPSGSPERGAEQGRRGRNAKQRDAARGAHAALSAKPSPHGQRSTDAHSAGKSVAQRPRAPEARPRPSVPLAPARLGAGAWLFTCRAGSERDVSDELLLLGAKRAPLELAPALIVAEDLPQGRDLAAELAFVRQGFCIEALSDNANAPTALAQTFSGRLSQASAYALHVWVADSPGGNALTPLAHRLEAKLRDELEQRLPGIERVDGPGLRQKNGASLLQVCLLDKERVVAGLGPVEAAISLTPGGRTRAHVDGHLPSRSARKLEEAFIWFGVAPGPGEVCVDLGAAPGGWTYVASGRRAQVIAIDPGALRADIAERRNVKHVPANAFTYTPEEPVDWLLCDMAYRPLEVAELLAKWGRRRWARLLVANIKLPMKKKTEILQRVREILTLDHAWKNVRVKQLYHDRDEVTLTAYAG